MALTDDLLDYMRVYGSVTPRDVSEGYTTLPRPSPTTAQARRALCRLRDMGRVRYVKDSWCWVVVDFAR